MKNDPLMVLEFASRGDKKKEKKADDTKKSALTIAAKKIRNADTDEDFAKALQVFIDLCSVSIEEEEDEEE